VPAKQHPTHVELAEARAKAQDAQSRARLATDPDAKRQWEALAEEWTAQVAELENGNSTKPVIPPLDGGAHPRE
jgi:hypothetical protein